jgi:hypothetical protein
MFEGSFSPGTKVIPRWGTIVYFGAGKTDMKKNIYGRAIGEANYLKLGSYILGFGPSNYKIEGGDASIAANDSGSPVIQKETGKVIAVASKSTAITTSGSFLPAISISVSLEDKSNSVFLDKHIKLE